MPRRHGAPAVRLGATLAVASGGGLGGTEGPVLSPDGEGVGEMEGWVLVDGAADPGMWLGDAVGVLGGVEVMATGRIGAAGPGAAGWGGAVVVRAGTVAFADGAGPVG